jgi:hypothetical protein
LTITLDNTVKERENIFMSKKMARKYEAAWNQIFYELSEWRQAAIIDEPHGRHASELAGLAATLAEHDILHGHEKNNTLGEVKFKMPPTGVSS